MRTDIAFIRSIRAMALIAAALAALWSAPSSAQRAGGIEVVIDRTAIAKIPDRTATVVVGNPLIADVSLQAGGTIVVTGKGYGVTNVVALDRAGKVIDEQPVTVRSAADSVIVYRGTLRDPIAARRIASDGSRSATDRTISTRTLARSAIGTWPPTSASPLLAANSTR
jgi:Flp pilus assembly secretin CpaC